MFTNTKELIAHLQKLDPSGELPVYIYDDWSDFPIDLDKCFVEDEHGKEPESDPYNLWRPKRIIIQSEEGMA